MNNTPIDSGLYKIVNLPMRPVALLVSILALSSFSGCSTGRTYHSFDSFWSLGYNDTRMGEDTWSVSYRGYEISQSEANDYAMLRAAEVTSSAGFKYFTLIGEQNSSTSSVIGSGYVYNGTGSAVVGSSNYPEVRLTIKAYRAKPIAPGAVYEASYLANGIRQKYGL